MTDAIEKAKTNSPALNEPDPEILTDESAENGVTLTEEGRPPEVNRWVPVTTKEMTQDIVVREMNRLAFDKNTPISVRAQLLDKLAKITGMYVERSETHHIDHTQRAVAMEVFKSMSLEERKQWLSEHVGEVPKAAFARPEPEEEVIDVPATEVPEDLQEEKRVVEKLSSPEDQTAKPKKSQNGCDDGDLPDFFTSDE